VTGDDWAIVCGGIFMAFMLWTMFGPTNPYE
jgi:hypothetical protein